MIKILFSAIFAISCLAADILPSEEQIKKDFDAGEGQKYMYEVIPTINSNRLVEQGIISNVSILDLNISKEAVAQAISSNNILGTIKCPAVEGNFTASIHSFEFSSGTMYCAVAPKGDLYRPIGKFPVFISGMKEYFAKDKAKAIEKYADEIDFSRIVFANLMKDKNTIRSSVMDSSSSTYLDIPTLFLATILTDTDIIDVPNSHATRSLQLNPGYTADILSSNAKTVDNADYVTSRALTISTVYARLSDLSVTYLAILVVFFGIWGVGGTLLRPLADKMEKQQNNDKKIPFIGGIIAGAIVFFPLSTADPNVPGIEQADQYSSYHTRFQQWERDGYYLFYNWAKDASKVIVDAELDNIISRSGFMSEESIVSLSSSLAVEEKKKSFSNAFLSQCNSVFREDLIKGHSSTPDKTYVSSEKYMYATSYLNGYGPAYYNPVNQNGYVEQYASGADNSGLFYPPMLISACGKAEEQQFQAEKKIGNFKMSLLKLLPIFNPAGNEKKMEAIKQLIKFQYELHRDWGALSILGLPVTVMQTENYENLNNNISKELAVKSGEDEGDIFHTFMSSLPYLFLPGMGTVFQVSTQTIDDLATAAGTAAGGTAATASSGGLLSWAGAIVGAIAAKIAVKAVGGIASLWLTYNIGQQLLIMAPIVAIIVIGILRFVIILVKIFSFHFISIFMMPIMFAKENWRALSAFALKIFATMCELPIFVLSIWLAMMANNLIRMLGEPLSKELVAAMIRNNDIENFSGGNGLYVDTKDQLVGFVTQLKLYFYDGFLDVAISVFSIIIIYKIITSIHSSLFEVFEVKTSGALDSAVDSMQQSGAQWGAKV